MQAADLNSVPPFHKGHERTQPIMHLAETPDSVRAQVVLASACPGLVAPGYPACVHVRVISPLIKNYTPGGGWRSPKPRDVFFRGDPGEYPIFKPPGV